MSYDIIDRLKELEENSRKKKHVHVAYGYRSAWQEIARLRDKAARLECLLAVATEHISATEGDLPEEVMGWVEERIKKAQAAAPVPAEPDKVQQELEGLRNSNEQHLMQITGLSKDIDKLKTRLENLLIERNTINSQLDNERTKNRNFILALNAFLEPSK